MEQISPFDDPAGSEVSFDAASAGASVLTVGRNATLTLGTDALIVLDEAFQPKRNFLSACGLRSSKKTSAIPFRHVLWAHLSDLEITIHYAQPVGRKGRGCKVGILRYRMMDKSEHTNTKQWLESLMRRAYPPGTKRKGRVKVLINPFGGQGNAQQFWARDIEPVFAAARCEVDVQRTTHKGHAIEIAEKLDIDSYDIVACASGDGLPHEVFNGLAKRRDARRALRKIAVCQLPCGSGNAMSLNLCGTNSPSLAAVEVVKGVRAPLDLAAITQGDTKYYSFLSQAVGVIAESDLGTEPLRWMGALRFTWGVLVRVLAKTTYPAEVSTLVQTENKSEIRAAHRRAREEHAAAKDKQFHHDFEEDFDSGTVDAHLPALTYGSVQDPLPSTFITQDIPNLGNFYVGNMCWMSPDAPFFTAALPSDGRMDMITMLGDMPRTTSLRMLMTIEQGTLMNFPDVTYKKIFAYRITPRNSPTSSRRAKIVQWLGGASEQKEGLISIDGEKVPFQPFQVEVVPRMGTVITKHRGVYEFDGPPSSV